jgi:hypothetical protein
MGRRTSFDIARSIYNNREKDMGYDKKYIACSLSYAVLGMALGIYMGMSQNHAQFITHAHILLVGFVVSFIYGVTHKLWLGGAASPLVAKLQFFVHHAAALTMFASLFLMFGNFFSEAQIGPVLGIASIGVLVGLVLMLSMVLKAPASQT